jgi:hypothetical protein
MNENTTTVKLQIIIEGKISGFNVKADENYYRWSDMESSTDIEKAITDVNKIMHKFDSFECIEISVTDGNCYNEKTIYGIRYIKDYHQYKKVIFDPEVNNRYFQESELINGEEQEKIFKKKLKVDILNQFALFEKIHLQKMYELLKNKTA